MDYKNLIETNFGIEISNFTLLDSHFGTDIFLVETKSDRFMVKKLPDYMSGAKNEGKVTDYLSMNGIKVPRLLKLQNGECNLAIDDLQFTVQEFIEGHTLPLNQATDSFLKKQAELLGKINNALMNFEDLPLRFGREFFTKENAINKLNEYKQEFEKVKSVSDTIGRWTEQIKHLEVIKSFNIDTSKLTYSNSHGDYNIYFHNKKDDTQYILSDFRFENLQIKTQKRF